MKRLRTQIKDFYTKHGSPDTPAGNTELNNLEQQLQNYRSLAKVNTEDMELARRSIVSCNKTINGILSKCYSVATGVKLEAPLQDYKLNLSKKMTGQSDPMETHYLHNIISSMVLSHPVQTWAIIPIIMREIAEVGRDAPTYDYCPLASNKYSTSDIPHCLSNVIESQSKALFAKLEMTDYAAVHKSFFTATHTIGNEKVTVQA
eukprot:SAG31_NODE_19120_length_611_cov_8.232422_1_plen_203_part_11